MPGAGVAAGAGREAGEAALAGERIRSRVIGREREVELALAAVSAGRDLLLEGPPGTSKTTILKAITQEWGIPMFFIEGNADLTPAKLVGHHNPAQVLREDYSAENFVPGPLVDAMQQGGFLYIEELNRAPEDTMNTLLMAMGDRAISVPRVGRIEALPTFRVVASMNPYDNIGTARLSQSIHDRLNRIVIGYQDAEAEARIVRLRAGLGADPGPESAADPTAAPATLGERIVGDAVATTRATRTHPDVRQGSSVRGAIDTAMIAERLAELRGIDAPGDERYPELFYDAMTVGLSGRIHVDEAVETTPERVLREIWEDRFILQPSAAAPG